MLLTFILGCSKDSDKQSLSIDKHCMPVETGPIIISTNFPGSPRPINLDSFKFIYPYSNPNNKNEFVYFVYDYKLNNSGIFIYNILTKQKSLVIESDLRARKNYPQSDIRWSKKGWLIFADFDANIYKIKPNGDSLTQLTFSRSNFVPEWNIDGTKFCIQHYSSLLKKHFTLIIDENGNNLDTIDYYNKQVILNQPHWQHDKYLLGSNDIGIVLYDYINEKVTEINIGNLSMGFMRWINNDEFIYNGTNGIFVYNITNNQIKQIRKMVNSNVYANLNLLNNNQIVCERTKTILLDSMKQIYGEKNSICIINPCDTVVTDIDLR